MYEGGIAMQTIFLTVFSTLFLFSLCCADENPFMKDRVSYSLGYQIGDDFKKENRDIDPEAFLKGVKDALAQIKPEISPDEMNSTLLKMKKKIIARQRFEKMEMREQRLGQGKDFLSENAKKEGVIMLPSGLQYQVIREGTGRHPGPTDEVTVRYRGTLIDGSEFSSSYKKDKPGIFHVNGVIRGISEALQLMKEGARWKLFIPPELGFGTRGLLANRTVIYDLELISVKSSG